jgi:hypothetical protein
MVNTWYLSDFKGLWSARTLSAAANRVKSIELYRFSLGGFEPRSLALPPIHGRATDQRNWPMMTFQLIGMGFIALFLGALVTSNPSPLRD